MNVAKECSWEWPIAWWFDALIQHDCILCLLNLLNGRQSNITTTVTTLDQVLDLLKNLELLKPALHLLLLWISLLCCVGPCWGWSDSVWVHFLALLYSTSCHLAVIFIRTHICTGSLIVKRSAWWPELSLSPLCHFTVYASRKLYAIKLSPIQCL